jgi:hypothetical protein
MKIDARLKILYLIAVSALAFILGNIWAYALLALQVVNWFVARVPLGEARYLRKTVNFILVVLVFYAFFTGTRDFVLLAIGGFKLKASTAGFFEGLRMSLRLVTVLLASIIVRNSTGQGEFIRGLAGLGLPRGTAALFEAILAHFEGREKPGGGGGKRKKQKGVAGAFKRIIRGDFTVVAELVNKPLVAAREKIADSDTALIFGLTVVVVSIRFVKILPGMPFAPGIKNLVLVPCLILASSLTRTRYAATQIGFVSGVMNFLGGFGRFGVFDILQTIVPAVFVDLLVKLTGRSRAMLAYALIGLVAGLARSTTGLVLALLFRLPAEYYVLWGWTALSQCAFGVMSAPVTSYLIGNINTEPAGSD